MIRTKGTTQTQAQIYERLAALDEETQERISQKYYHGTRPWAKRGDLPRKRRKAANQQETQEV